MGIAGLLKFVKSSSQEVHISRFGGQTVCVDASCWLHRGVLCCAQDLAQDRDTDRFLGYPLRMIHFLREQQVEPLLVFDGAKSPMKVRTDNARTVQRMQAKEAAERLLSEGEQAHAEKEFQKAARVTPDMVHRLIEELKKLGVKFVVAPHEADAQLAFL